MTTYRILIVEDDTNLLATLKYNLEKDGYDVISAVDGAEAVETKRKVKPDLIILDIMLPKMNGFEVCRVIRKEMTVPILMLTAQVEEMDKVVGLEIGADDYITKPFSIRELLARVKAHLRRESREENAIPSVYRFDDVEIDFIHYKVRRKKKISQLTSLEVKILKFLIARKGEVVSRDALLNKIWGFEKYPSTRTIDNHILKLRKKLEDDPSKTKYIFSVYGEGYRFMGG